MDQRYPRLLKKIATTASNLMPDFNDELIMRFRQRTIRKIPQYIDMMLREQVKMLKQPVKYTGYRLLSPEERIDYIRNNNIYNKRINIQQSTFSMYAFIYEYEGVEYPIHIPIPYLNNDGAVLLNGTEYYPLFVFVERGGLHRTAKDIIIKVMRAPLIFKRSETYTFITDKERIVRCNLITVKIHQRRSTGKRSDRTPLLLYHLVNHSFYGTMAMYGFEQGEIELVDHCPEEHDKDFSYIRLNRGEAPKRGRKKQEPLQFVNDSGIYIKVKDTALDDKFKQRVIASFMAVLDEYPIYTLRDLIAPTPAYYLTALGKFTYPTNTSGILLYENAEKHLATTKTLLDRSAQYQLSTIGINVTDIYDLLLTIFYNIDEWIVNYNPTDMFLKKIGALDQIMSPVVSAINTKLFGVINSEHEGFNAEKIKKFTRSASQGESWMTANPMFRAKPTKYNDNWFMTIGTKRFRSLGNTEQGNNMGGRNIPKSLLKSHYSDLQVESIMALPHSSPIVSGEINPYCLINEDGAIIADAVLSAITEHCYD